MAEFDASVIQTVTFVGVTGVVLLVWYLFDRRDRRIDRRMGELVEGSPTANTAAEDTRGLFARWLQAALPKSAVHLLPDDQSKRSRLQTRLLHAGINDPLAMQVFLAVRLLFALGPPLVGIVIGVTGMAPLEKSLLYGAVGGGVGTILPGLWLERKKLRRQAMLCRSLPDFLDLMVTCLESGLSLEGALQRVTMELRLAHPLLAAEMERANHEMTMGVSADTALANLSERTDLESIRTLSTFLEQARRFGASITDALRTHADMMREQREQRAEEQAQKASVKILFPTMLLIFPSVFVVLAGPAAIQLNEKLANDEQHSSSTP